MIHFSICSELCAVISTHDALQALKPAGVMDQPITDGPGRPMVRGVIDHVTCVLCSGYLIDATTVVGCLHSCEFDVLFMLKLHLCD